MILDDLEKRIQELEREVSLVKRVAELERELADLRGRVTVYPIYPIFPTYPWYPNPWVYKETWPQITWSSGTMQILDVEASGG